MKIAENENVIVIEDEDSKLNTLHDHISNRNDGQKSHVTDMEHDERLVLNEEHDERKSGVNCHEDFEEEILSAIEHMVIAEIFNKSDEKKSLNEHGYEFPEGNRRL